MVIETSANRLYRVTDTNSADLAHVWYGTEVKRVAGAYVPKKNARVELIRKAATRIVEAA